VQEDFFREFSSLKVRTWLMASKHRANCNFSGAKLKLAAAPRALRAGERPVKNLNNAPSDFRLLWLHYHQA
jgi:hypothetical protein